MLGSEGHVAGSSRKPETGTGLYCPVKQADRSGSRQEVPVGQVGGPQGAGRKSTERGRMGRDPQGAGRKSTGDR